MNIFTYGTLMDPEIWGKVVAGRYRSEKGLVNGYARRRIEGEEYPALIKKKDESTPGVIYYEITLEDIGRLDSFEGDAYVRISIEAVLRSREKVRCETYLFSDSLLEKVTDENWDFDEFVEKNKHSFVNRSFSND